MPAARHESAILARDLTVRLAGSVPTISGVDLDVGYGDLVHLIGPSGSGKTTLLRVIRGLVPLAAGSLYVLGRTVDRGFALASDVAFVPQHLGLVRDSSVIANVLTGALPRTPGWRSWVGLPPREELEYARELLQRFGIAHLADRAVRTISGGERQRTAIARAWMQRPRLVLADEFLAHLDPATAEFVLTEVGDARARGVAFVATTHDPDLIRMHPGRTVALAGGRLAHGVEYARRGTFASRTA